MKHERYSVKVNGIVQGVGFRPFIYNLAKSMLLNGWVKNTGSGVIIEVEGAKDALLLFVKRIRAEAPPLSDIQKISVENLEFIGYEDFEIKASTDGNARNTFISPDMSFCSDCERELFDSNNRRYLYPFINCTNCGPRFTIIKDVPYDRSNTTMDSFEMCDDCSHEYHDPTDRRYHAEPVSCDVCGPELRLLDSDGRLICKSGDNGVNGISGTCSAGDGEIFSNKAMAYSNQTIENGKLIVWNDPIEMTSKLLAQGSIVAIKGLGGYHLACDAMNSYAVSTLRTRKHRDEKPFALMAKDMETVLKYCMADDAEKTLLASMRKPIVLLDKKSNCTLPDELAPGNPTLGVMLPYTPLHLLLFSPGTNSTIKCPEMLVMTSGNISSEPICYKDEEVVSVLHGIADYFLVSNREIHMRTDDTVTRAFRGNEYPIRRSRGYVPAPLIISRDVIPAEQLNVLACGGELKNTFCMNRGSEFYLSHHIGDLENLETMQSFEEGIKHFGRLFDIKPQIVAYDLHPGYLSTQYAVNCGIKKKVAVQHHHAHIAACMAENGLKEDVIGLAFDGTGYGEDGNIWGSEFFTGSYGSFRRAAYFGYLRMPGGDTASREPWRMAMSLLYAAGINLDRISGKAAAKRFEMLEDVDQYKLGVIDNMLNKGINSPLTSGMGRLFDAVSALCGIRSFNSFEGQAAMELEFAAAKGDCGSYGYRINEENGIYVVKVSKITEEIVEDVIHGVPSSVISSKFHETLSIIVDDLCRRIREASDINSVVLSGGVFQNMLLLSKCMDKLAGSGFKVFIHSRVPANDGGISLGQAVIAMAKSVEVC